MMSGVIDALQSLGTLTGNQVLTWFMGPPLQIVIVLVVSGVVRWLLHRLIDRVVSATESKSAARLREISARATQGFTATSGVNHERHLQRVTTMGSILKSITTATVGTLAVLTSLALFNVPLAPLLTSAGIGGVALAFGAQSLVKDFLSGVFMIVEDQYGVGDVIDTGEAIGTVEDVSLRVTRLRDASGVIWYVRNGEILRIGNRSQGFSMALVDVPVAYDEDIDRVIRIMKDALQGMGSDVEWDDLLIEGPDVVGVESVSGTSVTIRVHAKCIANEHIGVSREILHRAKVALDSAGVRGPAPYPGAPAGPV